jgi:hypothetical protein
MMLAHMAAGCKTAATASTCTYVSDDSGEQAADWVAGSGTDEPTEGSTLTIPTHINIATA